MVKNVHPDSWGFIQYLQMHVYRISRCLAKKHMCTRIETGGKKKNSALVYIRFDIGSTGNNHNEWNACLSDCLELTMHLFQSI